MSKANDYFRVDMVTENGSLIHFHRCFPTEIHINKKSIDMGAEIKNFIVIRNTIILSTDHSDFYSPFERDKAAPFEGENLYALDTDGNIIWKSKDLITDAKAPFGIVYPICEINKNDYISWTGVIEVGHDYCVCQNSYEQTYLIDVTDKKMIGKRTYKC